MEIPVKCQFWQEAKCVQLLCARILRAIYCGATLLRWSPEWQNRDVRLGRIRQRQLHQRSCVEGNWVWSPVKIHWAWISKMPSLEHVPVSGTVLKTTCAVSSRQIGVAYITATSTALATAVGLNLYTKVQVLLCFLLPSGTRSENNDNHQQVKSAGWNSSCTFLLQGI